MMSIIKGNYLSVLESRLESPSGAAWKKYKGMFAQNTFLKKEKILVRESLSAGPIVPIQPEDWVQHLFHASRPFRPASALCLISTNLLGSLSWVLRYWDGNEICKKKSEQFCVSQMKILHFCMPGGQWIYITFNLYLQSMGDICIERKTCFSRPFFWRICSLPQPLP